MTVDAERNESGKMEDLKQGNAFAPVSSLALWYGALAGPVIWLVHLFAAYGIATIFCGSGQLLALHMALGVAALIAASAGVVAWRAHAALPVVDDEQQPAISYRRARFLARFGIYNSIIFLAAIVAQGMPNFFLDPCRTMG